MVHRLFTFSEALSQRHIQPAFPFLACRFLADAIIHADSQAFFNIKKVAYTTAVVRLQLREAEIRMEHFSGTGKGHNAKTFINSVTQFGLASYVITVAVAALVVAAHHFVAAHLRQQVKWRPAACKALLLYIQPENQLLCQRKELRIFNVKKTAPIAVVCIRAMHYVIVGADDHTPGGVGIVVPGVEGKAGADVGTGPTVPVLHGRRVQNTGVIIAVGVKVFYYARHNACIKVIIQSFLSHEAHLIAFFAYVFFITGFCIIANPVKIKRVIIKANDACIMKLFCGVQ